jgi:hypothetical protein
MDKDMGMGVSGEIRFQSESGRLAHQGCKRSRKEALVVREGSSVIKVTKVKSF